MIKMDSQSWILILLSFILLGILVQLWWTWKVAEKADSYSRMIDGAVTTAKDAIRAGSKKSVTDLLHEAILRFTR
jgi:hypothetical protein